MMHFFRLPAAVLVALLCLAHTPLVAQAPTSEGGRTVVRVKGLDSTIRDAVALELGAQGLKLAFACVPAGILVFEDDARTASGTVLTTSLSAIEKHVRAKDITVLPISLHDAEQQCAQARNR